MSNTTTFSTVGTTNWTVPEGVTNVTYLVVGGGGGGGGGYDYGSGGGGGGGMVLTGILDVSSGDTLTVTVGSGGSGATASNNSDGTASSGGNTVFDSITALGGGAGRGSRTTTGGEGNGGDGADTVTNTASIGGSGNRFSGSVGGGGGGGAVGDGGSNVAGGPGGSGVTSTLSGTSVTYGIGGQGGPSNSQISDTVDGSSAAANTGNGGQGGASDRNDGTGGDQAANGGDGGSGIIIIQYTVVLIPCVVKGTRIKTPYGYKSVENIKDGDMISTQTNESFPCKIYNFTIVKTNTHTAPYRIPKGYFSPDAPLNDILLSPKHAIFREDDLILYPLFSTLKQVHLDESVQYFHIEMPDYNKHQIVCENLVLDSYGDSYLEKHNKQIYLLPIKKNNYGDILFKRKLVNKTELASIRD